MMYDVIIIGAGPSGVTASTYLANAGRSVLLIANHQSALENEKIMVRNLYGFNDPVSGPDLLKRGLSQATNAGVNILFETVINIEPTDSYHNVITCVNSYTSPKVILASGKKRNTLDIKNTKKFEGRGINYCANCDSFLFKNKRIALIGYNEYMESELNFLKNMTTQLTIFTNQNELTFLPTVPVISSQIISFTGSKQIESITTKDNTYQVDAVFIALGYPSSFELGKKIGLLTNRDDIIVDKNYQTNIPNIYAIGDCIGGLPQITKATYDGMMLACQLIDQ